MWDGCSHVGWLCYGGCRVYVLRWKCSGCSVGVLRWMWGGCSNVGWVCYGGCVMVDGSVVVDVGWMCYLRWM